MVDQSYLKEILSYDEATGVFIWNNPPSNRVSRGSIAGYIGNAGYRIIGIKSVDHLAHRLAWKYKYGEEPNIIDHIDGDKLNNRISNLRNVNQKINMLNVDKCQSNNNSSKLRGVTFDKKCNKYSAQLCGKFIGYFDDAITAHEAYIEEKSEACRKALESIKQS